ncbi:MFS transporter [Caballeronia peredens]|nr:MFS transporter [Caballeronia peredens]
MRHLRRGIIGKIGGIAAICAMLLLSFAPVASQALEHARFVDALLASVCAADTHASRVAPGASAPHQKHDVAGHLQACGYCDLVAHAPTPPTAPHQAIATLPARDAFNARQRIDQPRRELTHVAQPRAPPALA